MLLTLCRRPATAQFDPFFSQGMNHRCSIQFIFNTNFVEQNGFQVSLAVKPRLVEWNSPIRFNEKNEGRLSWRHQNVTASNLQVIVDYFQWNMCNNIDRNNNRQLLQLGITRRIVQFIFPVAFAQSKFVTGFEKWRSWFHQSASERPQNHQRIREIGPKSTSMQLHSSAIQSEKGSIEAIFQTMISNWNLMDARDNLELISKFAMK